MLSDVVGPICLDTPDAMLPNPDNCAQYYDCHEENSLLGHYLMECPYPQLFNDELGKCSDYTEVVCGTRFEPKSPCKYLLGYCIHFKSGRMNCFCPTSENRFILKGQNLFSVRSKRLPFKPFWKELGEQ